MDALVCRSRSSSWTRLLATDAGDASLLPVRRGLTAYQRPLQEEFRLLQVEPDAEARRTNEENIEPAFEDPDGHHQDANRDFDRKATLAEHGDGHRRPPRVLVFAAVLLFALFRRFERAQRHGSGWRRSGRPCAGASSASRPWCGTPPT